ncbi:MAG: DUF547 domain-containing protein, partial [Bacteroidota bacterium]
MKNISLTFSLIILTLSARISLAADLNTFFKESDSFLRKYVMAGKVSYKQIKNDNSSVVKLIRE